MPLSAKCRAGALMTALDHQQRAAGEREDDYAAPREVMEFYLDKCRKTLAEAKAKRAIR